MATKTATVFWQDDFTELESLEIQEIDCDLLNELLGQADVLLDADEDMVEFFVRSLQAEICPEAESTDNMEDILLDLQHCGSSTYQVKEGEWFEWAEMETRKYYMDVVEDQIDDCCFWYHNAEISVEQLREPLW